MRGGRNWSRDWNSDWNPDWNPDYGWWPVLVYPLILGFSLALFFLLRSLDLPIALYTNPPIVLAAAAIAFFEWHTPYRKVWSAGKGEYATDALYMVLVQMLLPKLLAFAAVGGLVWVTARLGWQAGTPGVRNLWPHHWNPVSQALLMLVAADFPRYWLHWLAHRTGFLWSLHAVHHASPKLYWLNVNRFHPLDKALQFLCDGLPFLILAVQADVLALYFVFYAVNGFFQHCNIELRLGCLNYVLSGPELHRWHHSRKIQESNSNYGNKIILWDLLFGTYFRPRDREVGALGLLNPDYPAGLRGQWLAPFSGPIDKHALPHPTVTDLFINGLLRVRMILIGRWLFRPLARASQTPGAVQLQVLMGILARNRDTEFGLKYGFADIKTFAEYRERVPVHDYEALRPYIERQMRDGTPNLTRSRPVMYNQTSGTTGAAKYIPVCEETLKALGDSQKVFSYVNYRDCPEAFAGKLLGLVSPAIEGRLESGTPYGSASGHIYASMPYLARSKYAIPVEVFAIADYETKYHVIARLALAHKSITYMASANPSTFQKLLSVIQSRFPLWVGEIAEGRCAHLDALDARTARAVRKHLRPNPGRAAELLALQGGNGEIRFADIWPYLKLVGTWTGGSCGIPLNSIRQGFPEAAKVIDLGYMSSEFKGTVPLDSGVPGGVPTLQENVFEFVERREFEAGGRSFMALAEIETGREYYVFVTTPAGLYRYDMNDIVRAAGRYHATPTLEFVRKGKGITNITGEKLSENQIIGAVAMLEKDMSVQVLYFQALADESESRYHVYLEVVARGMAMDETSTGEFLDFALQAANVEYRAKRLSGRLGALRVHWLKPGASEAYKAHCLALGQREGQFKPLVLQYRKDFSFKIGTHCAS